MCAHTHFSLDDMTASQQTTLEPHKHAKALRCRALIEAATAIFAEHGFDPSTTRQIAERAGCAEGLIHRYFNGKRGLLQAILETKATSITDNFRSALPERRTIREEIEQMLLWHLDTIWERRDFMRVVVSQASIDPEIARTVSEGINAKHRELILEKLRHHQGAGRISAGAGLEAIAATILGLGFATGFLHQVCFGQDQGVAREYMVRAAAVLACGIKSGCYDNAQDLTGRTQRKGCEG